MCFTLCVFGMRLHLWCLDKSRCHLCVQATAYGGYGAYGGQSGQSGKLLIGCIATDLLTFC